MPAWRISSLAKTLLAFQLGGVLARAEDPQSLALKGVDDPDARAAPPVPPRSGRSLRAWRTGSGRGCRSASIGDVLRIEASPGVPRRRRPSGRGATASASSRGHAPAPLFRPPRLSRHLPPPLDVARPDFLVAHSKDASFRRTGPNLGSRADFLDSSRTTSRRLMPARTECLTAVSGRLGSAPAAFV